MNVMYIAGSVLAAVLFFYLLYALFKPEAFQ